MSKNGRKYREKKSLRKSVLIICSYCYSLCSERKSGHIRFWKKLHTKIVMFLCVVFSAIFVIMFFVWIFFVDEQVTGDWELVKSWKRVSISGSQNYVLMYCRWRVGVYGKVLKFCELKKVQMAKIWKCFNLWFHYLR